MRVNSWLPLGLLAGGLSCADPGLPSKLERTNLLRALIADSRADIALVEIRAVVVMTERGCLPCTKAFSKLMENHVEDPSVLFWVSASGQGLDISAYQATPTQVIWDHDDRLRSTGILEGSGAILLRHGAIDTIIDLEARGLEGSLQYIIADLEKTSSDPL